MNDPAHQHVLEEIRSGASHLGGMLDSVVILATLNEGENDIFFDVTRGSRYAAYALAKEFCLRWEQQTKDQATREAEES